MADLSSDFRTCSLPAASALLTGEGIAGLRVGGFEGDDVIGAEAGDGAGDDGLGVFADRDFLGEIAGDAFVGLASHEAERVLNLGFGKQVQIGRLFQLHGEGLFEGAIENGIAGGVDEVGEDDGVFVGEGASVARGEEVSSDGDGGED